MNSALSRPPRFASASDTAAPARSLADELAASALIGRALQERYVPEALVSESPLSACYRAQDDVIHETVHVELLPRRAAASFGRIRHAVARLAALGDPNIVDVIGLGLADGARPFLVTEYPLHTLRETLAAGPLELARLVRLGAQMAGALSAAHGAEVVHGALLPERIVTRGSGPLELAKLSGFGVAAWLEGTSPLPPVGNHEARYAAPERLASSAPDKRSDVYSLGAILYELATGTAPGEGAGLETRPDVEPPSRRRGSTELAFRAFDKIIARCLLRAPDQRYPNAAELATDLWRLDAALGRAAAAARARAAQPDEATPRAERSSAVELSPAHRPPQKSVVGMRRLPKVIVQSG